MISRIAVKTALASCMAIALGLQSKADPTQLSELLENLETYHPELRSLKSQIRGTRESIVGVRAAYQPNIFLEGNIRSSNRDSTLRDGTPFGQTIAPRQLSVRLSQTLYNGGRRPIQTYGAMLTLDTARARYNAASDGIKSNVIQSYVDLVSVQDRIVILERTTTLLDELKLATYERVRLGDSSNIEAAQVESRIAAAAAQLATARSQKTILLAELEAMANVAIHRATLPVINIDLFALGLEETKRRVRDTNSGLHVRRLEERTAQTLVTSEARSHLPTIALEAAAVASDNNSPTIDQDNQLTIGLRFTMPLYSGGQISSERRRAIASAQAAKYSLQNERMRLDLQTGQIWQSMVGAQTIREAQLVNLEAAEEALNGVTAAQKAGLSSATDVLDAVETKLNAELALLSSDMDLARAQLILLHNMGDLETETFTAPELEAPMLVTEDTSDLILLEEEESD